MLQQLLPALRMTVLLTLLTGFLYPGLVTAVCEILFPRQAAGSLIERNGSIVGSSLLGQNFTRPEYFHPRPSAAGNDGYDAAASSGSNLGPTSRKLIDRTKASIDQFRKENPTYTGPVPADAVTASGSGLDPHISPANASAQATRVAVARRVPETRVRELISRATSNRDLGFLGEPRVNVLELNLLLDTETGLANHN